jgi:UDP-3-O-[3-hydroxymyristoyl] glucosamine N-acyltransferase
MFDRGRDMKTYSIQDILDVVDSSYRFVGQPEGKQFATVAQIYDANEIALVWVNSKKHIDLQKTRAAIILCDDKLAIPQGMEKEKCFIIVEKPKLVFLRVVEKYFTQPPPVGLHPTAFVHPDARIGEHCYIGPFSYVGKSTIGNNTVLWGHCHIYDDVQIGNHVMIHAGTVIGSDGFGYSRNDDGELEKFPHIGGVVIEDRVEIGSNTSVDRGTLSNTVIKEGAKIDNFVHVAHNVVIGKHAAVIAHAMIGGSTEIGDYGWIAPSAALMNGLRIGNGATVGLGAVVTKNIPDNETWAGVPAMPLKDFIAIQRKLKEK